MLFGLWMGCIPYEHICQISPKRCTWSLNVPQFPCLGYFYLSFKPGCFQTHHTLVIQMIASTFGNVLCSRHFTYIKSTTALNNFMTEVLLLPSFHRWENWGRREDKKYVRGRAGFQPQPSRSGIRTCNLYWMLPLLGYTSETRGKASRKKVFQVFLSHMSSVLLY